MTLTSNNLAIDTSILPFVIQTEEQYHQALTITEKLFFKSNKTALESQILEVWSLLIENYEESQFSPGNTSTPNSILKTLMESKDIIQADLVRAGIGSSGVMSAIINGKRQISKQQAKKLADFFQVSLELFI
jgi:HTH-type transcriptional regulator/antitoxin HigA